MLVFYVVEKDMIVSIEVGSDGLFYSTYDVRFGEITKEEQGNFAAFYDMVLIGEV